jgi:hypothetical protein
MRKKESTELHNSRVQRQIAEEAMNGRSGALPTMAVTLIQQSLQLACPKS